MKLFSIPSDPEIEKTVSHEVKTNLKLAKKLSRAKAKKISPLSRLASIRFKLLHRQFNQGFVPGLSTTVGAAHRLYQTYRKINPAKGK